MDSSRIDRRLLQLFETLMQTRSVSLAAKAMGMSQPSVSYGLNTLRELTGDPLFVRVKNEMRPTPHALSVAEPIRRVLDIMDQEILGKPEFSPATSRRQFTLCMTDLGEVHYLPTLVSRLQDLAPHVSLRVVSLAPELLERALEDGDVDLAVGFFPDLDGGGIYQQQVGESGFVCIARKANPHVGETLTLEAYCKARHVAVNSQVRNLEILDRRLQEIGLKDQIHVALRTPHFMTMVHIVTTTNLIATATMETAQLSLSSGAVRLHALPFEAPRFPLRQHWHRRFHQDPANQWLRRLVHTLWGN